MQTARRTPRGESPRPKDVCPIHKRELFLVSLLVFVPILSRNNFNLESRMYAIMRAKTKLLVVHKAVADE